MTTREAITLRAMRFHTTIGILPHERELSQPLEVDLTVWRTPFPGAATSVVDYRALYDLVASVALAGAGYLEEVAHAIADRALATQPVDRVRVAVRKPHVALPGPLAHAEIVLERDRGA